MDAPDDRNFLVRALGMHAAIIRPIEGWHDETTGSYYARLISEAAIDRADEPLSVTADQRPLRKSRALVSIAIIAALLVSWRAILGIG